MARRVIVTSALPYANGPIHFGHVVGAYLPADVYVRYRRMLGDEVHFVCGTDEHGVAITLRAEQEGVAYTDYVDRWHKAIGKSLAAVGIEFDVFTGTSHHRNPHHRELAQQFFTDLLANGYLVDRTEDQYYSATQNRFLPDRYIQGTCYLCGYEKARGDECPRCGKYLDAKQLKDPRSTIDGSAPVLKPSKHWYLELGKIRDQWLRRWFEGKHGQWKPNVENFVASDLDQLRERPITRDLPWGVPVPLPGTEGKVLYVWFDAPIGYLSISKQHFTDRGTPERFEQFWKSPDTELYHFIGKDNITFHVVVFPAMLWGTKRAWIVPTNVPANEFFNLEGRKFNTSSGWYVPEDSIAGRVSVDSLRYALCAMMPETADSEWTWTELQSRVNDDLADNLGNFVTRTLRFVERFFDRAIPAWSAPAEQDLELLEAARAHSVEVRTALGKFQFRRACQAVMSLGNAANKFYDAEQPWVTIKSSEGRARCAQTIRTCVEIIHSLAVLATPIVPATAAKMLAAIGAPSDDVRFESVGEVALLRGEVRGAPLCDALPKHRDADGVEKVALFPKIPDAFVAEQRARLTAMADAAAPAPTPTPTPSEPLAAEIDYERFAAVDLRAGTVRRATKHPKADRLLVVEVDLGFETRTIVAGIAGAYTPEALPGRRVVVVANLQPRALRGIESCGMLLAANDASGAPRLVEPDAAVRNGTRLR